MGNLAVFSTAGAALLIFCASAPAFAAGGGPPVWDGRLEIAAVDPTCAANGINIDVADYGALYRPKLQDGDPNSALAFFTFDGMNVNLTATDATTQMNGSNIAYSGVAQGSNGLIHPTWAGTVTFAVSPAPVTQSDVDVKITGRIANFANVSGCTLTIAGAFMSRP